MARDEFAPKIIEKLKARVAHRCSNPKCRVPTSAPSGNDKVNSIGIAAHICAASPGGPRYDGNMTVEERKSIDNAIWLCSNCSIDIDRDTERHSVAKLKEWKMEAEATARAELGRRLPSDSETIDTVAAALTGSTKSYLPNAISNVHRASEKSLENLDPRFQVKTSHRDGETSVGVYAKENVQCSMTIRGENVRQYLDKYQLLFEHGRDFEIESESITIEGSALLKEVFETPNGILSITPPKLDATQKLWLIEKETGMVETFDDIRGVISFGAKTFNFKGDACCNLFSLSYQRAFDVNDDKADITMTLCLNRWEGVNLKNLPFLEKLHSLFVRMSRGWELFTSLEINGTKVFVSKGARVDKWEYVVDTASLLNYVTCCSSLAHYFGWDILFVSDVTYTSEEHKKISEVVEIVEGRQVFDRDSISGNFVCDMLVDSDLTTVLALKEIDRPVTIRIADRNREELELFGKRVCLPSRIITLDGVVPIMHGELESLKKGDVVSVEWEPQTDFRCTIEYESRHQDME